jgi:hypothetical protein
MVAEVPERLTPACELFSASGYEEDARLTDYVLQRDEREAHGIMGSGEDGHGRLVIPVTVDDLAANGVLDEADPHVCWQRSVETLTARKDEIAGLAVVSDDRIEASLLHTSDGEIVFLRSIDDGGTRLYQLLDRLLAGGMRTWRFAKVHPAEVSPASLERLGFRPEGSHRRYAATARGA